MGELRFLDFSAHFAVSILGWMNLGIIRGHYVDLAAEGDSPIGHSTHSHTARTTTDFYKDPW